MNERPPSQPPTSPPPSGPPEGGYAHRAPAETWRPMSGLCLTAFVLALVLSILALMTLWIGMALPLLLGGAALLTVDARVRRGRGLAWAAVFIALGVGAAGLLVVRTLSGQVQRIAGGVVSALRAERPADERDELLRSWLSATADREAVRARVHARYAQVVERLGPARSGAVLPSLFGGQFPLLVPPTGVVPVDDPDTKTGLPAAGAALWVDVEFERGTVHVALTVGDGSAASLSEALARVKERPEPIVADVRFYVSAQVAAGWAPPPVR